MFWTEAPSPEWEWFRENVMRVKLRLIFVLSDCSKISNQNHRIRVFFFINLGFESPRRWESNCWEWWIYRKSFSFHSVKFAPFWQNLGRQAHVQCIPFWGDPNFLPCKTSRIASSFLQIFTQPCVIPVTQPKWNNPNPSKCSQKPKVIAEEIWRN